MSSANDNRRLQAVIVGGGIAGLTLARELDKIEDINVTLITNKDFTEFTPLTGSSVRRGEREREREI